MTRTRARIASLLRLTTEVYQAASGPPIDAPAVPRSTPSNIGEVSWPSSSLLGGLTILGDLIGRHLAHVPRVEA